MPFQVSYSFKAPKVTVIVFFTAGEDQVTVCDTTVFLEATVIGDLTGHTIIWEQISGVAVTFNTPLNQFAINYTTANFQDKVFRFTIDKGTGNEQFDDINIFGTPTFPYFSGGPDQNCIINFGNALHCDALDITTLNAFPLTGPHGGGIVECDTSSSPRLYWDPPCEADLIVQYVVQERSVAGVWTEEAILPPTANLYTPLNIGSTYRILTVRRELNSAISSVSSNTLFVDGTLGIVDSPYRKDIAATESAMMGDGGAKAQTMTIPTFSLSLLTLLVCPTDAPDDHFFGGPAAIQGMTIPTFTVDDLSLVNLSPDVQPEYFSGGPAAIQGMTLPTFTVLDLEGGDIGG